MKKRPVSPIVSAAAASVIYVADKSHGLSDSDIRIEQSFTSSYIYETYLSDGRAKIDAKDGVVTLTGVVDIDLHRILAEEAAISLAGVARVENELVTDEEIAAENADTWIERKVKLALLFHRHVNASQTNIEVINGVCTLRGDTSSIAQKELTAKYAAAVSGVTHVNNELVVVLPPLPEGRTPSIKVDDVSIAAQVKTVLRSHQSTISFRTYVLVRQGLVTLTGVAQNEAEKALVTELVGDIHGVQWLRNHMTIKSDQS